jgi:hypothetical protein
LINAPFVDETLRKSSGNAGVNPLVGWYLTELCGERESFKNCRKTVESLRINEKVWAEAMKKLLNILMKSKSQAEIYSFIKKNWNELKKNDEVWALTGYALNALEKDKKADEWFSDWRQRKNVLPWMLWNYAISLRRLGKLEEANLISRSALSLQKDSVVSHHRMMLGLDEMHAGKFEAAAQFFHQIDARVLDNWDRYFYYLLETGLSIYERNASGSADEADKLTKELVKNALSEGNFWADKMRLRSFRQTLRMALSMSRNGWLKFYLRGRLALSWLRFQINNPYGQ